MRQRSGIGDIRDCFPNSDALDPSNGNDVAQFGFSNVGALQSGEGEELGDLGLLKRTVKLGNGNFLACKHLSVEHTRDGQAS